MNEWQRSLASPSEVPGSRELESTLLYLSLYTAKGKDRKGKDRTGLLATGYGAAGGATPVRSCFRLGGSSKRVGPKPVPLQSKVQSTLY